MSPIGPALAPVARILSVMEGHPIDAAHSLSDEELLKRTRELLGHSRQAEAELLAHLGELEARRLYARFAASSMFGYCTRIFHLSEHEAYLRITAARAARKHPVLLAMLADGRLHLTGVARLAAHLTSENCDRVLERARHKSMREVEELIAELSPAPDARAVIRKLPERGRPANPLLRVVGGREAVTAIGLSSGPALQPQPEDAASDSFSGELVSKRVDPALSTTRSVSPRATIQPTAPARFKVQFTASAALRDKLERLQALMRDCELADAIEAAVTEKLARLESRRFGAARASRPDARVRTCQTSPSSTRVASGETGSASSDRAAAGGCRRSPTSAASRHVPAAVRRAVWERDGGRCRYVDARGQRCDATRRLEFHHRYPFAHAGAHTAENVCLMCRTHNLFIAELDYGRERTLNRRRSTPSATAPAG